MCVRLFLYCLLSRHLFLMNALTYKPVHTFLNSYLILHMNLKFLYVHMSVFPLHLSGKLPSSSVILNFLFLLLCIYTFFYTFYFTYISN